MLKSVALGFSALSVVANAGVINAGPSPVLRNLEITQVAPQAQVLKVRQARPYTTYLIGVKVRVNTGNACTKLAGQSNGGTKPLREITAVGASDALQTECIAVMPMPVEATFTVEFPVLTGGIVAADRFQKKIVQFNGAGLHQLELDTSDSVVTVKPVAARPR